MPAFRSHAEIVAATGTHLGYSDWLTITQERINAFANATDDHQWIHVDPVRAASGPFGSTIAPGYLTLSLVNRFLPSFFSVEGTKMGVNCGCDRIRFPAVVPEEKKGGTHVVIRVTVEIEGSERPAAVIDTISRFYW